MRPLFILALLRMYTLRKELGQHFLKDENVIDKIIQEIRKLQFRNLLEVGPGGGALTKELIKLENTSFKAVELDQEKIAFLIKKYPALTGKIIHKNFLDIDAPFEEPFAVTGNFPYNISSQILFKILEWKDQVPDVIGMFQKEVAERAAAAPGSKSFGVLTAMIQPWYQVEYLFDVPPECFNPPPKVMSGVIRLIRKNEELNYKSVRSYETLVKTAFNQRRKTLRNAAKPLFSAEVLKDEIFQKRAEQLSIEDFAMLTHKMQ